jgi:hypothetical protein
MKLEPGEAAVHCRDCNGYLHSMETQGETIIMVSCPYKCRRSPNGGLSMTVPPGTQPYGRS